MGASSKRHHYVPQCLTRNFCYDGKLWYAEKSTEGAYSPPEPRQTRSVFWHPYYYTVHVGGKQSDVVEKEFFQKLDNRLGEIVAKILYQADKDFLDLSLTDQNELSHLLFHLIVRTPQLIKVDDTDLGRELFEEIMALSPEDSEDRIHAQKILNDPKALRKHGRDIRVQSQILPPREAKPYLDQLRVGIAKSYGTHSFIISDPPAYQLGNGGNNGLKNSDAEIWLPISPKVALIFINRKHADLQRVIGIDRDFARKINEYAARGSRAIASHSYKLLCSLTGFNCRLPPPGP